MKEPKEIFFLPVEQLSDDAIQCIEKVFELLEAIKAKYLCLHDWEVLHKTEYVTYWEILLKCKSAVNLERKEYERSFYSYN